MDRRTFRLVHEQARRNASAYCLAAPEGTVARFAPAEKSREQEEKYHAQIGDIARQVDFFGRKLDKEAVKRLLVDAFHYDTKEDTGLLEAWVQMGDMQFIPALNHAGVVALGFQTKRFPKKLAGAFIEWLYAFGAENNVAWSDEIVR